MTEKAIKYISISLFVIVGLLLLFLNLSIIVENEVLTGLTVYHEDTLYVIDQDNLVGRQYIEPNNDIKIGRLINSMQLINIQKGNIIEIKEIENYLPPENIEFSEVYAFNNEVKADEATFKDSARGTIYRCEFFDYDSELCLSSWQVYLENVDGEFAAPIGESAYAISGIALQGEEFVLEEITEEETSEELNATTEEEIDATEEIEGDENETAVSQEIGPEEAALEEVDINIVGSYCIYTGERFKACERIVWQGGTYAKGYITGGETLKLSSEQHVNEFIYCQDLDKPGKKAANAYLFDEKGKLLTTHFGTKVDCNTQTTTFNEEEFYNKPVPKEEPEIISEPEEEIIVEMPLPEGVTVDEIEVDGLRAYETTRLLSTYGTPLGEEDSKQFQVVLNRPTKWSKKVILPKTVEGVRVNIPKEAARLKVRNEIGEFVDYDVAGEAKTSGNLLTGRAISEELQIGDSENGEKELLVNEPVDEVTIEYELPGPTSTEEELVRSNKKVTIQSDVHYTNVLAYTRVDNVESNQLSLLWLNEKGAYEQQAFYDYVDTDNDGRINEVWWVVPSLSGQVYIVISSQEQYNMSVQSALNKNSGGQDSLVGTYPSSCTLDRLSCNDGQVETSLALIPANNISSITAFIYNNSIGVGDCSSIADVEVIYEWWRAGNVPATTCNVSVSNGTNTYVADTTCPGNVSNPGISVVNVSNAISGLSWTCKTFFNTTTFPFINATMMRTANGLNFSVDILAFNVTFANDTDVPNVTNLTNTPVNVLRHETIYINSTVADTAAVNGLVETVILQINFSNGTFTNYSTTGVPIDSVSANYYNNTVSTNWSGVHSIKWFANDTTGKINSSERSTFQVNDTQPPNLTSATETPDPVEFGRAIELNITCDDDVACSVGIVQATFPNGTKTNYTATLNNGRFYNRSAATNFVGPATLNWYVNDTSGNLNTSVLAGIAADFTAQDTTPPNATLPLETPDPVGAGSVIEVNITCEDANACSDAIVQAHFLFNGTKTNYTTTLTAGRFWNRSIPTNSIATGVDLNWTVNDTSNNVNRSEGSTFSIVAANSPANVTNISISPASPNTIDQLNCSYVVILHNQQATTINVSWLNGSTYAESTELNYINNTLNSTTLTSGKQGEGETWNCTVNTSSITGNANSTTVTVVTTKPSLINLAPVNGTNFTAGNFNTTLDFTYIENTNQNGDLFIFASNSTGSNTRDGLVYYAPNQANATAVSYNFTSIPVYSNSSGLVGLWHFDNRSAYGENQTYAFDFSENDNNITLESGVKINDTTQGCKLGGCLEFDGINDRANITEATSLNLTRNITISLWVKNKTLGAYPGLIEKINNPYGDNDEYTAISYDTASHTLGWVIRDQSKNVIGSVSTAVPAGTGFYHVAGTYDGVTLSLYINGGLVGSTSASGTIGTLSTEEWYIGTYRGSRYFNGTIDDVAVWNRSLSAAEVKDVYRAGAYTHYWYANATDGSGYTNKSDVRVLNGNSRAAPNVTSITPINNTNFTAGNFNTTLNFTYLENVNGNTSDLFIFASNSTGSNTRDGLVYYAPNQANATAVSYNFTSIPVYSNSTGLVGLWHFDNRSAYGENQTYAFDFSQRNNNGTFKGGIAVNDSTQGCKFGSCISLDGFADFVAVGNTESLNTTGNKTALTIMAWIKPANNISGFQKIAGGGGSYDLYTQATNELTIYTTGISGIANPVVSSDNVLTPLVWNHVVATWDGTTIKLYVNAVSVESGDNVASGGNFSSSSFNFTIGKNAESNIEYFNGTIDDVAIFNRSLSASEVKDIYRAGAYTYYWYANATASDGITNKSDTRVLNGIQANIAPNTTNISLSPSSPNTSDTLNCSFIVSDANSGDPLAANISWYNGSTLSESANISVTNGTLASSTLIAAKQAKAEVWNCTVTAWDQYGAGNANSTTVTVVNSPPAQVTLSDPPDGNVTSDRSPNLSWNAATDPDNDPINYTINISCNGGCTSDNRYTNSTIISHIANPDLKFFGDDGYNYTWSVLAHDGASNGQPSTARNFSVAVQLQLSLGNATMLFGSLAVGATDDTTDDSPLPFNVSNDGNSMIDVNVTATPIFNSSTSMTYDGKVDNTTETGSFNWSRSTTTFTAFSTITNITIAHLNYSNSTDSAEVDVKVVVPPDEPFGNKTSTVTFTAAYVGTPG